MSKGLRKFIAVVGIIAIASVVLVGIAFAQDVITLYPSVRLVNTEGELIFEGWFIENDDMSCIQMSNGNFFCCCGAGCSIEEIEVLETVVPKDPTPTRGVNDPTPTPKSPTNTPVIPPTSTPVTPPTNIPPTDVPPPEPTACNSGRGNASEGDPDCDPGNSGGHNEGGD